MKDSLLQLRCVFNGDELTNMSPSVVGENETIQRNQRPSKSTFSQTRRGGEFFERLPKTRSMD